IIHCDLALRNIMVNKFPWEVKLAEFGLAQDLTRMGSRRSSRWKTPQDYVDVESPQSLVKDQAEYQEAKGLRASSHRVQSQIMAIRVLEIIFFFYFASHIPITLFIDLQALLPGDVYPQPVSSDHSVFFICLLRRLSLAADINHSFLHQLVDLLRWYAEEFKDPMMLDHPEWFKSFVFCEALLQMPFFPIAAYAFLKGA
ncbi:hypothetical protein GOODEAATRI_024435, partial [Goodea atripinnis]